MLFRSVDARGEHPSRAAARCCASSLSVASVSTVQQRAGGAADLFCFLGALSRRPQRSDTRYSAIGGLCIGIIENLGITISSASFRDIFAFGFLILVLLIRPGGFVPKVKVRP